MSRELPGYWLTDAQLHRAIAVELLAVLPESPYEWRLELAEHLASKFIISDPIEEAKRPEGQEAITPATDDMLNERARLVDLWRREGADNALLTVVREMRLYQQHRTAPHANWSLQHQRRLESAVDQLLAATKGTPYKALEAVAERYRQALDAVVASPDIVPDSGWVDWRDRWADYRTHWARITKEAKAALDDGRTP